MSNIVRYHIDLHQLPPITEAQKSELEALDLLPDAQINTSDIPLLTESFWQNAVQNPLYKPKKTSTTIRLDADVLAWLKSQGKGYQTKINAILRQEMLNELQTVR